MVFGQFAGVADCVQNQKFLAGTEVCSQNFWILAQIDFSARLTDIIMLGWSWSFWEIHSIKGQKFGFIIRIQSQNRAHCSLAIQV